MKRTFSAVNYGVSSKHYWIRKIVFALALLCLPFYAMANVYAVHNIHVDITAENATKAKENGIADAQEKAFYKLLNRLTLVKDLDSLPVLSTEDILNLVRDFSVSNEKTSSVRYIADVDVQFDPDAIQSFFQDNRVPYVNAIAGKSLIFPLYRDLQTNEILLWKSTNPWSKVLSKAATSSNLVPFVVPFGDVDDMGIINEENFEKDLKIDPLLQRYNCKHALVAELTLSQDENVVQVVVKPFQNSKIDFDVIEITEPIDAPMPEVLKRTADRVVYSLEQSWREKNAVRFDDPVQIEIAVQIKNLTEWLEIRKQLDKISVIKQYIIKSLSPQKAEIEVFYVGELDNMKSILQKEELFLIETQDGLLLKKLADMSEEELNLQAEKTAQELPPSEEESPMAAEATDEPVKELKPSQETDSDYHPDVRTFGDGLYEQIQPETMEMFKRMKKEE